jgi:hypothetical protein
MDNIVYEQSVSDDLPSNEFVSKQWVYVNDSNQGSYNGQVIIDTTALSNQGGYQGLSEAFLCFPLVITLSCSTAANLEANTTAANYSWAFKNGFWQILNSMSVQWNNGTVIQESQFLNVFTSFKAMTSWSWEDIVNDGASCGFYPDNAQSWSWNIDNATNVTLTTNQNTIYANGVGICNNRNFPYFNSTCPVSSTNINNAIEGDAQTTIFNASNGLVGQNLTGIIGSGIPAQNGGFGNPSSYNPGMLERQNYCNYDPGDTSTTAFGLNQGTLNGSNACATNYRSYLFNNGTAGYVQWSVIAKLRLKDLSDFFAKMCLVKGGACRIMMNTNQAITNFTIVQGATNASGAYTGYPLMYCTGTTTGSNGLTFPLQVASCAIGQGSSALKSGSYSLSVSVYQNNFSAQSSLVGLQKNPTLNCVRLYCPIYKMNPMREAEYLKVNDGKKTIIYNDIIQYQYTGIGASGNFSYLASNGVPNLVGVLVCPLVSSASNGVYNNGGTVTTNVSSLLSPFSTTGATPDPIELTNFNVQVSGYNLFMENENYDFQAFIEQLRQSNQINGNATTGFTSGLINENSFSRGMRWYYADASRIIPSESGVSRSVQILGQNLSNVSIDLLVFIIFKKQIIINLNNGATISQS